MWNKSRYYDIWFTPTNQAKKNKESEWITSDSENITEKHDIKFEDNKFLNGKEYFTIFIDQCSYNMQMNKLKWKQNL